MSEKYKQKSFYTKTGKETCLSQMYQYSLKIEEIRIKCKIIFIKEICFENEKKKDSEVMPVNTPQNTIKIT